jgi:hypothetical protein
MNYADLVTAVQDYSENTFPTVDINRFIEQAEQKIYNSVQLPSLRKNVVGVTAPANKYLSCPNDYLASFSLAVIENYGTATERYTYLLNKDVNFIREGYPSPNDTGLPLYYGLFGPQYSLPNELSFILGPTPDAVYRMELHYFYYPASIVPIVGVVTSLQLGASGSNYTNGTYSNIPLTTSTGVGSGCTANITVASGAITNITVSSGGGGYVAGDSLLLAESYINTSGSGGNIEVTVVAVTITNPSGTTWLGDNFDTALLTGTLMEAITYMKGEPDLIALYKNRYDESMVLLKQLGDAKEKGDSFRDGVPKYSVT